MKEQLFIQNEAHTQHLSEALQVQAGQLEAKWAGQMEAKLIQQESHYQLELVKSFARLRTIEALIDAIANAGKILAIINGLHVHQGNLIMLLLIQVK